MAQLRLRIQRKDHPTEERSYDADQAIVGRSAGADLFLSDELASRRHARFYQDAEAWWIEDLGARNRTHLNGQELVTETKLRTGDHIRIGTTDLHVVEAPSEDASPLVFEASTMASIVLPLHSDAQAARMAMLNEVHRALASPISLDALLHLMLERCFAVLQPEEGVVILRDKEGDLQPAATRRLPGATGEMLVSRQIIKEVVEGGRSALVLDASVDSRFSASPSLMFSGVRSVVAAPLIDATGTLGMIALYSRVGVRRFSQEDLDVLVSLASAAALRVRNVALAEEAAERRVLERELTLANEIQTAMLPQRRPNRPEIEIGAALISARSVGGDLYDFVLDGDHLWFIVGDVSGKGMAAALYMAVAKTLFRAVVQQGVSVGDAVSRINRELSRENEALIFVTAVVGRLDLLSGTMELTDAGHNAPLLLDKDGHVAETRLHKGLVLGAEEDFQFTGDTLRLEVGEALAIYTDGISEALSTAREQYQVDRLIATLTVAKDRSAQQIVNAVVADVNRFAAGAPQEDDITLLIIRYRGPTDSTTA